MLQPLRLLVQRRILPCRPTRKWIFGDDMSALDGTVTIAGKTFPKKAVVLGVTGVTAIAGYVWYQRRNATISTPTDTTGDQIDPATGFPYGSAEDAQALAAQAGYDT